ncbi:MAG: portal protein [Candidatus Hodarchaeales archaeon]
MPSKAEILVRRYTRAKSNSDVWQSYWNDVYRYVFPDKNLYTQKTSAQRKNQMVFDLTAFISATQFISQLHLGLTPLYQQWAILAPGEDVPEEQEMDIRQGLQKMTDIMFRYLDGSNFNLVINEAYHDLVVGTAAFLCLDGGSDEEPLKFRYVPLQDLALEKTQYNNAENVWRTFDDVPVEDILLLWPKAKLTSEMNHSIAQQTNAKFNLIEGTVYDEKKKVYTYYVMEPSARSILYEEESESSPWIIFRWSVTRGEAFGRGPGVSALPTILTLNKHVENIMRSNEIAAYPIYMGWTDGVYNPFTSKLDPKTIIPIAPAPGGTGPLLPLPAAGQPQLAEALVEDLRTQIKQMFFDSPLGGIGEDPNMTATEVNIRNQMMLEKKAPAFGRLQVELADKLLKRVAFILRKRGLLPNIEINNKQVRIEYKNQLAQIDNIQKVQNLMQVAQTLQSIVGPQATLLAFKSANLPKFIAENYNVDLELINGPAEFAQAQQQLQQAAQQQTQLPSAPEGGIQPQQGQAPGQSPPQQ